MICSHDQEAVLLEREKFLPAFTHSLFVAPFTTRINSLLPWNETLSWQGMGMRWPEGCAFRWECVQPASVLPPVKWIKIFVLIFSVIKSCIACNLLLVQYFHGEVGIFVFVLRQHDTTKGASTKSLQTVEVFKASGVLEITK